MVGGCVDECVCGEGAYRNSAITPKRQGVSTLFSTTYCVGEKPSTHPRDVGFKCKCGLQHTNVGIATVFTSSSQTHATSIHSSQMMYSQVLVCPTRHFYFVGLRSGMGPLAALALWRGQDGSLAWATFAISAGVTLDTDLDFSLQFLLSLWRKNTAS